MARRSRSSFSAASLARSDIQINRWHAFRTVTQIWHDLGGAGQLIKCCWCTQLCPPRPEAFPAYYNVSYSCWLLYHNSACRILDWLIFDLWNLQDIYFHIWRADFSVTRRSWTTKPWFYIWKYQTSVGFRELQTQVVLLKLISSEQKTFTLHEDWVKQYGPTMKFKDFLGVSWLSSICTNDLYLISFFQSQPVWWPLISKQTITYFSIVMTITKSEPPTIFFVKSLEMVSFPT
jgi:hypothetical protein